jgi:hypothetical protein
MLKKNFLNSKLFYHLNFRNLKNYENKIEEITN